MAPNLNSDDYYQILGCPKSADEAALKKAYRKLAVKWHPDKNPGNEEATKNFQKISEAYAVLSDDKKRKVYDQYGLDGVNAAEQNGGDMPTGGGHFHGPGAHFGGMGGGHHGGMSEAEAQAFFSTFFGGSDPFMSGFGNAGSMHGARRTRSPFVSVSGGSMQGGDPFQIFGGAQGMSGPMGGSTGMPGMRTSMHREPMRYDAIPAGTIVSLKGLVNAADRNGDRGKISSYNAVTGRYVVELEDTDETMSVKASNLLQHVHVRVHGLQSKPELNGKMGTVITWNTATGRYNIYVMAVKHVVSLKPTNVILEEGTVGQITALNSKPELNGKWGTIKGWNKESNRYDIQLSASQIIRIKAENLRV